MNSVIIMHIQLTYKDGHIVKESFKPEDSSLVKPEDSSLVKPEDESLVKLSKEIFDAIEKWAKNKKQEYSSWINYLAIRQGKYISVYYIVNTNKKEATHNNSLVYDIVENRGDLDYTDSGVVDQDTFHEMINDDDFRNILDVEWYRGTDPCECYEIEDLEEKIREVHDY